MSDAQILVYGTGYTGVKIIRLLVEKGYKPTIAARNPAKVDPLAKELELPSKVFPLTGAQEAINEHVKGFQLVLHCAGPYIETCAPMLEACIVNKAHYLDITGEHSVLTMCYDRHEEAAAAGIVVIPAVGFDVVPSDMLIGKLHDALPDATHIHVMLDPSGTGDTGMSRGTAKTVTHIMQAGGFARRDGKIVPEALNKHKITLTNLDGKVRHGQSFPLADIVSGGKSTNVPNITMYVATKGSAAVWGGRFMSIPGTRWIAAKLMDWFKGDPAEPEEGARGASFIGKAVNDKGDFVCGGINTIPGYVFTAPSAVACAESILNGDLADKPGAHSPVSAFGSAFIDNLCDTKFQIWPVNEEPPVATKAEAAKDDETKADGAAEEGQEAKAKL